MSGSDLVARNVRRFRIERGLSIGEVARRSGLSKQTVSKLEMGEGNPTVDTLIALAAALEVSARRLLTEFGSPVFVQRADEAEWRPFAAGELRSLYQVPGSGYVTTRVHRLAEGDDTSDIVGDAPGTLHQAYVIEGKVCLGPLADAVEASAGDFVRFPGDVPYRIVCLSEIACVHVTTTVPHVRQSTPLAARPA